jgi:hypothetical protein
MCSRRAISSTELTCPEISLAIFGSAEDLIEDFSLKLRLSESGAKSFVLKEVGDDAAIHPGLQHN